MAWCLLAAAPGRLRRLVVAAAAAFFSTAPSHGCPLHAELARRGAPAAASLALYSRIRAAAPPTPYTFSLLLAALASSASGGGCTRLAAPVAHAHALKVFDDSGAALDAASWNTMVSGYGKSGDLAAAREVFGRMPVRNLVSWSAMVDALVRAAEFDEALRVFDRMMGEGFKPDVVVLVSVLKACAHLGAVERGRGVHRYLETEGLAGTQRNVMAETALVDMYCKCGCMEEAWRAFDSVRCRDVVLWNSMIGGLAMNGHGERALELFQRMFENGFVPNQSTFVAALCACTHTGRLDEGRKIFQSMRQHGIEPQREHYGCLADLLGRAGRLEEAEAVLLDMPMEPHASQWGALMSSCRMHNDITVGERVGKRLIELEPQHGGRYAVLFNLYAVNGRWEDARAIRQMMVEKGARKELGFSFME
ncbi:hypothetical protein ZWY2020_036332 [Hordeum vulgare]|nr:hypothetical protein ZWY2020_036332 [Hordeum vulgare]